MIIHQFIAYAIFATSLSYIWEKLLRIHTKPWYIRLPCRIPISECGGSCLEAAGQSCWLGWKREDQGGCASTLLLRMTSAAGPPPRTLPAPSVSSSPSFSHLWSTMCDPTIGRPPRRVHSPPYLFTPLLVYTNPSTPIHPHFLPRWLRMVPRHAVPFLWGHQHALCFARHSVPRFHYALNSHVVVFQVRGGVLLASPGGGRNTACWICLLKHSAPPLAPPAAFGCFHSSAKISIPPLAFVLRSRQQLENSVLKPYR